MSGITNWARNHFGSQTVTASLSPVVDGKQDVQLGCPDNQICLETGKQVLQYYPAEHKLVQISLGNAGKLEKPGSSTNISFYDDQVADSFKLLN